jgi:hypothetical protein
VGILLFHLIKSITMRKIHHLLAALSILIIGGSTLTMIHGTTMPELYVSLLGMISGGIIFLIYAKIDNEIKNK